MFERRADPRTLGLELAALRVEHALQANLIVRLADALYATPEERSLLRVLEVERRTVADWAAGLES